VLQVLALVQRRGAEVGGDAVEIGRLAGEQEAALRALIAAGPEPEPAGGEADLRSLLSRKASAAVSVIAPAGPVLLPPGVATELAAAVHARSATCAVTPGRPGMPGCCSMTTGQRSR
jgi:hypothetical protein